jgi:hypothetical protein
MPKLSSLSNSPLVKLAYIGDSGTGKTGSLVSLVKAGYHLHVLDMDNGLPILGQYVAKECPDKLGNIDYVSYQDPYVFTQAGPIINGNPTAYVSALKSLTKWEDGTVPADWGPEHVLVIDSFTHLGRAAFEWAKGMNPTAKSGEKQDGRMWYHTGQQSLYQVLSMLKSDAFKANVVVISHIKYDEDEKGNRLKGYMNGLGSAMGPILPSFFNNLVLSIRENDRRSIRLAPTNLIDLKTAAPFKFGESLPLESGLATIFQKLKEN